ncbi:hypothetical protein Tco_1194097 [Tanacetum coccineum]
MLIRKLSPRLTELRDPKEAPFKAKESQPLGSRLPLVSEEFEVFELLVVTSLRDEDTARDGEDESLADYESERGEIVHVEDRSLGIRGHGLRGRKEFLSVFIGRGGGGTRGSNNLGSSVVDTARAGL